MSVAAARFTGTPFRESVKSPIETPLTLRLKSIPIESSGVLRSVGLVANVATGGVVSDDTVNVIEY